MSSPSPLVFQMEFDHHYPKLELDLSSSSKRKFLKPEEFNQGFVSDPLKFYEKECQDGFGGFGALLQRLGGQPQPQGFEKPGNSLDDIGTFRMVFLKTARSPSPLESEYLKFPMLNRSIPLKVKLISDQPIDAPRSVKEQNYLAKLGQICGTQGVVLEIGKSESSWYSCNFWIRHPLELHWNEEDLAWETESTHWDYHFGFNVSNMLSGVHDDDCYQVYSTRWSKLVVRLNEIGINRILEHVYGRSQLDSQELRGMLEEGRLSDLVVISANTEEIKAHRVQLSAASPVFADMLRNDWEEAKTGTVKLPESEDAIKAMLHFIYYGGTQRILAAGVETVLELLQTAHKYMIANLAEVTGLVLEMKIGLCQWFSVDAAVDLFCFARNVDGKLWKDLMNKSCKYIEGQQFDVLKDSEGYMKLYQIATKLGPLFEVVLTKRNTKPVSIPNVPVEMSKEEVALILDFLCACSVGGGSLHTLEIAVAMLILAEYCGQDIPSFTEDTKGYWECEHYAPDFLIELFCKARMKQNKCWGDLKMVAAQKLKELLDKDPKKTKASAKYKEMFSTNPEAAAEFTLLTKTTTKTKKRRLN